MSASTLSFQALDTLFFRESRPFEAIGGSELSSLFPPPPRTLMGAVRTAIGDALGADWNLFGDAKENYTLPDGRKLYDLIGYGDKLGGLSLHGIWLTLNGERLYPAPLFLLQHGEEYKRLKIGEAKKGASNNLGNTRLPELPDKVASGQPLENTWLTAAGLDAVLCGNVPTKDQIYSAGQLFEREPRLGIARNNDTRTAIDGLLYQSEHVRPKNDLTIEADISGLPDNFGITRKMVRLGAEGRLAGIQSKPSCSHPASPQPDTNSRGLILMLMSTAHLKQRWLPDGFNEQPEIQNGITVWRGVVEGIALTLHSAVIGKAQREGGWNMAIRAPRPAESLVPAGSAYYCTVDNGNHAEAIAALHGKQIGSDQNLGRGIIFCGLWQQNEFNLSGEQQ